MRYKSNNINVKITIGITVVCIFLDSTTSSNVNLIKWIVVGTKKVSNYRQKINIFSFNCQEID